MRKFFIVSALMALCSIMAVAQNSKFGKPSQFDWSMNAWGEAPDAEALVLYKSLDVSYQLLADFKQYDSTNQSLTVENVSSSGTNKYVSDRMSMSYQVKMRTKILKDSGARFANIDIVYYSEESERTNCDEIFSLSVTVFDNSTGKVKRQKLTPENWSDERLDAHYMVRHVRVPGVKAGNIIEYKYDVSSRRVTFLYDFQVQEEIPVLYAKCVMDIPAFLQFNMNVPVHPFVKSKVEESSIALPQEASDLQAPKKVKSNLYTIESRDMLPKALDLQRNADGTPAANIEAKASDFQAMRAMLNIRKDLAPALMPAGKRHLMINPE